MVCVSHEIYSLIGKSDTNNFTTMFLKTKSIQYSAMKAKDRISHNLGIQGKLPQVNGTLNR